MTLRTYYLNRYEFSFGRKGLHGAGVIHPARSTTDFRMMISSRVLSPPYKMFQGQAGRETQLDIDISQAGVRIEKTDFILAARVMLRLVARQVLLTPPLPLAMAIIYTPREVPSLSFTESEISRGVEEWFIHYWTGAPISPMYLIRVYC